MSNICTRNHNHETFGGILYSTDFEIGYGVSLSNSKTGSYIASRICNDWRFDKKCERNAQLRDLHKKNK